ncbi:U-box domain-containing protein 35-like isoform X1 [Arachis ipaensis]|uniref:U-box domain-containing protein 35-like isoform X1 n=2 Tax=Arachis ipaensis TaxID=130454 RepID=UPI000A2B64FF|nr:U-box domain-containing protein 35-like isoform X1 [Arachis ipaensis]
MPRLLTMVAVDKDKNSVDAFRWATENIDNPIVIAVHVKDKEIPHQGKNVFPPDDEDLENIFNQLRQECHPKVLKMKEAVIYDSDPVKAIIEYAERNRVHTLVLGAPTGSNKKNTLAKSLSLQFTKSSSKKVKGIEVATGVMRAAPEYISVYVIKKGKIVAARASTHPLIGAIPPRQSSVDSLQYDLENKRASLVPPQLIRGLSTNSCSRSERITNDNMRRRFSRLDSMAESVDLTSYRQRLSMTHDESSKAFDFNYSPSNNWVIDDSSDKISPITNSPQTLKSSRSKREKSDVEAEMNQLKQMLKQTMDLYSVACKEAIAAQNKAREINQWKLKEAPKIEQARLAEEAAMALAEEEKAKAKAAMEKADEAMKMAEEEAKKRAEAERKAKLEAEEKERALNVLAYKDFRYRKYTIGDIEKATNNFSLSLRIGEGGYGPVFKGQLDHTPVAIKILRPDASQGRRQFHQEVEVLCSIRHPNMVLLLGACPDYGCLVYEFMDNGSLEDRLIRKNNTPPLSWPKRFEIAAEIATALLFLHQAKPEPIVHRDLKPANILLDRNFVSKISDVGLARLVPPSVADSVTQYYMTTAAGTMHYIDPEYQQTGKLTTKSDVYSLGIMLLQIITAKPPLGLTHQVKRAIEKGQFSNILDPSINDWPVEEALSFAKLALQCSELRKKDRPNLGTVVVPELDRLRNFGYESIGHNNILPFSNFYHATSLLPPRSPTQVINNI